MLFSSSTFLALFLPVVLLGYYGPLRRRRRGQNIFLTLASLFFYAWGEPWFVLVMMGSIAANYGFGRWVAARRAAGRGTRAPVIWAVVSNLGILFLFKYLTFVLTNMNLLGLSLLVPVIRLPIGISFFTFQAMSYVLDVNRGRGEAQKSLLNVGLYISFFPQLIAGPIVKYETVAEEILHRQENWEDFTAGVHRFLMGLGKKVILSNQLAIIVDAAYRTGAPDSVAFAWLGAAAYTLQVYFDFGGYSDMAIGLGRMFGFHFLENFNYPCVATSATAFWKRWHISLTSWFRDYVYIPLGGSRTTRWKAARNFFLVWLLTGIWHGANWTYIVWGLVNYAALALERYSGLGRRWPKPLGWLYAQGAFTLSMVFFRSDSLGEAGRYFSVLFGMNGAPLWSSQAGLYFREYWVILLFAVLCAAPTATWLRKRLEKTAHGRLVPLWDVLSMLGLLAVFTSAVCFIVKGTYNPFIYFNF